MRDVTLANFSKEMDECRREMRKRLLTLGDVELQRLYYRTVLLSEHEAVRRTLLDRTTEERQALGAWERTTGLKSGY